MSLWRHVFESAGRQPKVRSGRSQEAPIHTPLPSPALRVTLAARVRASLVETDRLDQALSALGRLGLALAHRPWPTGLLSRADLRTLVDGEPLEPLLALATQATLLEPAPAGGWRVRHRLRHLWLAARYVAATGQADAYVPHASRGELATVVAIAAALLPAHDSARLVEALAAPQADADDRLQLANEAAMRAVAWGATASTPRASSLLALAAEWTELSGSNPGRRAATAFLASAATQPHVGGHIREGCRARLEMLVDSVRANAERAEHPLLLAAVHSNVVVMVAADLGAGDVQRITQLVGTLGAASASLADQVGQAIAELGPLEAEQQERLVASWANQPTTLQDRALDAIGARTSAGEARVLARLAAVVDRATPDAVADAIRACVAVTRWTSRPNDALKRIARHDLEPDLRVAALSALQRVEASNDDHLRQLLRADLDSKEPGRRTVGVYGALRFGDIRDDLPAMALGLVANGAPASIFGSALADALAASPTLVAGFDDTWALFDDEPRMVVASLACIAVIGENWRRAHALGHAHMKVPARPLKAFAIQHLGHAEEAVAGLAAEALAAIAPADAQASRALRTAVEAEQDTSRKCPLVAALGAMGPLANAEDRSDTASFLAGLAASAPPALADAAATALMAILKAQPDAAPVAPFVEQLIERAAPDNSGVPAASTLLRFVQQLPPVAWS